MKRRPWKLVLAAGLVAAAGCVALSFTIGCGPVRGYVPSGDYVTLRHDCADRPLYLIAAATVLAITLAVAAWIARWRLPRSHAQPGGGTSHVAAGGSALGGFVLALALVCLVIFCGVLISELSYVHSHRLAYGPAKVIAWTGGAGAVLSVSVGLVAVALVRSRP
jgi:hypothetical protein